MGWYWTGGAGDLGICGWRRRSVRIVGVVVEHYIVGMADVIVVVWACEGRALAC